MYRAALMGNYAAARGGFLSGLVRTVGRVVKGAARVGVQLLPGPAGAIARQLVPGGRSMPGGLPLRPQMPGVRGGGSSTAQTVPFKTSGRRMNAGNAKAARRAIRRIKSVRKLLQSIERELPRRPAARSAGVITRREAERALRS